jgi:muconolactone D-isomerase
MNMEFLVEFDVNIPDGTPESELEDRERAEASAARRLAEKGHLVRVWRREGKVLGLYRAQSRSELDGLLGALPLYDWIQVKVTPLEPHPNDPAAARLRPAIDFPALRARAQRMGSYRRSLGSD